MDQFINLFHSMRLVATVSHYSYMCDENTVQYDHDLLAKLETVLLVMCITDFRMAAISINDTMETMMDLHQTIVNAK